MRRAILMTWLMTLPLLGRRRRRRTRVLPRAGGAPPAATGADDEPTSRSTGAAHSDRAEYTAAHPAPAPSSDAWIDAAKWKKVRVGMSELEVVGLLGAPTSMREVDGARVLFYALEIGASGFLGGSVKLRDRVVSEVLTPALY